MEFGALYALCDSAADAEEAGDAASAFALYARATESLEAKLAGDGAGLCAAERRRHRVLLSNAHNSLGSLLAAPDAPARAIAAARHHFAAARRACAGNGIAAFNLGEKRRLLV